MAYAIERKLAVFPLSWLPFELGWRKISAGKEKIDGRHYCFFADPQTESHHNHGKNYWGSPKLTYFEVNEFTRVGNNRRIKII